ncbi:MAG: hypothetical protein Q7T16_01685 [Candidatus Burarchaeum sp.]|nr:hypothetical protein [Candidatus Burarchaeum sp.]
MAYCTLGITGVSGLIGLSVMLSIFVISLIFMLGRAMRSSTIEAWVKLELYQVLATILFVSGSMFFIGIFCSVDVTFFSDYINLGVVDPALIDPAMFPVNANMFDASSDYLVWLQNNIYGSSTQPGFYLQVKSVLMKWEVQASKSEFNCPGEFCLMMPNGWSIDPGTGFYTKLNAGYAALQALIISMLSVSSLRFMLEYASAGALLILFPIGAFFRSIPYMRGFGGALMALALTLYLALPFILFVNALVAYPVITGTPNLFAPPSTCSSDGSGACIVPIAQQAASASFVTVFLPALDFILLAAIGRDLARLFGSELDLTGLSQLV